MEMETTFVDGIKVHLGEDWALVLPDQYLPVIHIVAEARDPKNAQKLLDEYKKKVEKWKKELQ
jgi:mannose-1-phosphate guanylyltransferase/phosphomannomutase